MKKAIVLCSGGLDSVVTAYYVKKRLDYEKIVILFFDYGQKSLEDERLCAEMCARDLNTEFKEIRLPELGNLSASLINKGGEIKKLLVSDLRNTGEESKKWYVPCRNVVFLVYALALAESEFLKNKKISDIFVGFKNEGNESYPDTTKKFVEKINSLGEEVCAGKFEIFAPLIEKDKEDIVLLGKKLGVDFAKTFSCYAGSERHCGNCLACKLRQQGFYWAGVEDPTNYAKG
ncbi:MAG: 7-cyano-7-deazaguanine synthase [Nanoarchaeota archaeon]|nr:7-cyano-7-deazaguanine synthase [Nanoarchaeota archaeon]MBU1104002.1 7-cyano-7-deazaguanine synthase [Nanoarchaeota archaeon]